jgi:hypothetical protein
LLPLHPTRVLTGSQSPGRTRSSPFGSMVPIVQCSQTTSAFLLARLGFSSCAPTPAISLPSMSIASSLCLHRQQALLFAWLCCMSPGHGGSEQRPDSSCRSEGTGTWLPARSEAVAHTPAPARRQARQPASGRPVATPAETGCPPNTGSDPVHPAVTPLGSGADLESPVSEGSP